MEDYGKTIQGLRTAFRTGKTRPVEWRIKQLRGLLRMYEENVGALVKALHQDLRKPLMEAMGTEVDFLKNDVLTALREIKSWTTKSVPRKTSVSLLDDVEMRPEPYGVVLIIGAWNYPLNLSLAPLTGAIAAGNCAVVKPSEISPHTAKVMEELLPKYIDPDCFKVINGGVPETTELLKQRFDYIFYTGSTVVGRVIAKAASAHLTPCTLELGGKSPVYVSDDCPNLERAVKRLLWGKMLNLGQTCIAPDYVLCSKTMQARLIKQLEAQLKEWYGDKIHSSPDLCRIVSERHYDRLMKMIENTKGRIAFGGTGDRSTLFVSPTAITDVAADDASMREEIFGPVLPFVAADNAVQAIDFINDREKPLVAYVFTEDPSVREMFTSQTSSGTLVFNETMLQMGVDTVPFGGVGESGMGGYHGEHSFNTFSHMKPVLIKDLGWLGETLASIRYPPYKESNIKLTQLLLASRWIPKTSDFKVLGGFLVGAATAAAYMTLTNA